MRSHEPDERVSPLRVVVALVRFGGALLALVPALIRDGRRPDPITLEPRVLRPVDGRDGPSW